MASSALSDGLVFLTIARGADSERIEAARWSSDDGDREIEFADLPRNRRRSTTASSKRSLSELAYLEATVRRWSAGRTVIAQEAPVLRERLEKAGWIALPPLVDMTELTSALTPRSGRRSLAILAAELGVTPPNLQTPGDAVRSVGEMFDRLLARLDRYDESTLERIALLAAQAGWTSAGVLQNVTQARVRAGLRALPADSLSSSEAAFMTSRERPETLKATKSNAPVDSEEIARVLSGRGPLSAEVPGFELRPEQIEMAERVGDAFNADSWLLAEAGTGTGKSLAYLVPSALHALERGERVVVSTNTRALQDQLLDKEIPAVASAIGRGRTPELTATSLKGRGNYLCLRRWFAADRQPVRGPADASARAKVHAWLPVTNAGERAELELDGDEERQFDGFSAEGEPCVPGRCPFQQKNQCFLYRARRVAEGSHIVVVNHALLLSDLARGGGVIPEYERVIVDEAHNLEEQATSHFGYAVAESAVWDQIERIIKTEGPGPTGVLADAATLLMTSAFNRTSPERAVPEGERLQKASEQARRAKSSLGELYAALRNVCREAGAVENGYGRSLRLTGAVRLAALYTDCEIIFDTLAETLRKLDGDLRHFIDMLEDNKPSSDAEDALAEMHEEIQVSLEAERAGLAEISAQLAGAILDPDMDRVYWIEISPNSERTSVHCAPLHVGELLRETLFERMQTVVLTSATLTANGGFGYIKERLGFGDAEELDLESPFNYKDAALLYLVDDVPEPHLPGYQPTVNSVIAGLGGALHGRTLVLFTSYSAMRSAYYAIKPVMSAAGVEVLAQRLDGSPAQLIERFRASSGAILLGVATFWEGIDVVGPALSALVIAKLPFAVPSEPVFAARGELFDDAFREYATPQAVLRFKQGFGRLIRSSQDRGVCVVLDRRIISKRYGKSFVSSAPPCTVEIGDAERLPERAVAWIAREN